MSLLLHYLLQGQTEVLSYDSYMEEVLKSHPISKAADLKISVAEAIALNAEGAFDTRIQSGFSGKEFGRKNYYRVWDTEAELPTPYGFSVKGGYSLASGNYLNPEANTPTSGLWSIGIEANLWQGLLIDEARTGRRLAEINGARSLNERQKLLNELKYQAGLAYLNWQLYKESVIILEEGLELAQEYLNATRESFLNGDKPAIDTLEAYLIVGEGEALLNKGKMGLQKALANMENYLPEGRETQNLDPSRLEDSLENPFFSQDIMAVVSANPEIRDKELLIRSYEIEGDLKREKLKPKLKIKLNPLFGSSGDPDIPFFTSTNVQYGLDFSMPIQRRSEKAQIQLNELKAEGGRQELLFKRDQMLNKAIAAYEQFKLLGDQVEIQTQNVINSRKLLEGEREKFSYGESSVFLLNKRQEKFIANRLKLVELRVGRFAMETELRFLLNEW